MLKELIGFILSFLSNFIKVKKNRIMFYSYSGEQYSCSPRYLAEYLDEHYHGKFEIIWAFRDISAAKGIRKNFKTVKYNSPKFLYYYTSSRFIVNNIFPYVLLKTKKNQIMIDTWHGGGAYKCAVVEEKFRNSKKYRKTVDYNRRNISLFLSSSRAFTKCFIRHDMHYKGQVLNCGLVRNDLFFCDDSVRRRIDGKVRKKLGIEKDEKLFLYAPTWRSYTDEKYVFDVERLRNALSERFGGKWRIIFRMHRLTKSELVQGVTDACDYPDMQELLLVSDFMMTDYSSCIWDYALTRKPLLLYAYDLKEYTEKQGFYEDIHRWKLPVCENFDEVVRTIKETSDSQFAENAEAHFRKLGGYDRGNAAEQLADYIIRHMR